MSQQHHYQFSGELVAPVYTNKPVLARNHIFPLKSVEDYETHSLLSALPSRRSFLLPSELYSFISELMRELQALAFEFEFIFIRLGAPILEKVPNELLAANVFISVDGKGLLDLAQAQGCRRILYINNNFLINYVNDFGDNTLALNLHYDEDKNKELKSISSFLAERNIQGEFTCLSPLL